MTMCLTQTRQASMWGKKNDYNDNHTKTRAESVMRTHTRNCSTQEDEEGESRVGG